MTKKEKEEQERLEIINNIVNRKTNFTEDQICRIKRFIFNILTSKSVMNRYVSSEFGDVFNNNTVKLSDCIEYMSNEIIKEDNNV